MIVTCNVYTLMLIPYQIKYRSELKSYITLSEKVPDIIALTEIKTKNKWQINDVELNIDGYDLYSNNLWEYNRGIVIYVKDSLTCKQIFC